MERGCARGEGNIGTGTTKLFTHNIDVDIINDKYLSLISGAEKKYEMTSRGSRSLIENLKKELPFTGDSETESRRQSDVYQK
jgi:hypothetical protein